MAMGRVRAGRRKTHLIDERCRVKFQTRPRTHGSNSRPDPKPVRFRVPIGSDVSHVKKLTEPRRPRPRDLAPWLLVGGTAIGGLWRRGELARGGGAVGVGDGVGVDIDVGVRDGVGVGVRRRGRGRAVGSRSLGLGWWLGTPDTGGVSVGIEIDRLS